MSTSLTDWTFEPNPELPGSYYRKIEDIGRGLSELDAEHLPEPARFIALYFGCEKLAKMTAGIFLGRNANDATEGKLKIDELRAAIVGLRINFAPFDIDELFLSGRKDVTVESGRALRDRLNHEFGPTNVKRIRDRATKLTPLARSFLGLSKHILEHLRLTYRP
jgi:hypothetical protein